jgi:predicted TIM-barrel fold metal-dependent hydrolase
MLPPPSRSPLSRPVACAFIVSILLIAGLAPGRGPAAGAAQPAETMTADQVMAMPKIDAHAHLRAMNADQLKTFAAFLERQNLQWLNICTGGMNWTRLKEQIDRAQELHRAHPSRIAWATSFDVSNWTSPDWEQAARSTIADGFNRGAVAVKVWKDVGMVLKDKDGRYVMIDEARFNPVLESIAKQGHPLVAHLGEPRNCWLPADQMTVQSDRNYFSRNPQYHGFLHPEVPGYEKQIAARDAMLERHPRLKVVGCHLGSLEYDVDELAKRLDRYPNLAVDLAARLVHLQIQPREKVRNFILKYQDRLLYGTDAGFGGGDGLPAGVDRALADLAATYRSEATWLATDEAVEVPRAREGFKSPGLALPAPVLRKVYFENAKKWYPGI